MRSLVLFILCICVLFLLVGFLEDSYKDEVSRWLMGFYDPPPTNRQGIIPMSTSGSASERIRYATEFDSMAKRGDFEPCQWARRSSRICVHTEGGSNSDLLIDDPQADGARAGALQTSFHAMTPKGLTEAEFMKSLGFKLVLYRNITTGSFWSWNLDLGSSSRDPIEAFVPPVAAFPDIQLPCQPPIESRDATLLTGSSGKSIATINGTQWSISGDTPEFDSEPRHVWIERQGDHCVIEIQGLPGDSVVKDRWLESVSLVH